MADAASLFKLKVSMYPVCEKRGIKGELVSCNDGIDRRFNCFSVEKNTADFLHVDLDMPGLCIDDVEISVEGSFFDGFDFKIRGVGKESEFGGGIPRMYFFEFGFPQMDSEHDVEKYQKEMENGLLRIRIPKIVRKYTRKFYSEETGLLLDVKHDWT
ncbi:hypothetical protein POM88_014961 [Heracleum sosnowskyi]|uniref:SHSP domain-containing protein n=1 Tax=Heracleum sosnowskyi TaxID=360622 RepID=A0AAD8IKE9_9APIA|nr:hypothetical protein POM88_014961 [Heracleum sosnowskyi]